MSRTPCPVSTAPLCHVGFYCVKSVSLTPCAFVEMSRLFAGHLYRFPRTV